MKKFFLIAALAVTGMAFANGLNRAQQTKAQLPQDLQKVQLGLQNKAIESDGSFNWQDLNSLLKERKQVQEEYAAADEYFAEGAFHLGIYEGLGAYSLGMFLFPLMDSVVYTNVYGPTDWTVNGQLAVENSEYYVDNYWVNGFYYLPETADHDLVYNGKTYLIKGTKYALGANGQYAASAVESKYLNDENLHMTLCAMYTDTLYEPDYGGDDMWMVGGYLTNDDYLNGTGIHLDADNRDLTADTLGILVDNRGLMKIEQILFPIYNSSKTTVSEVIPDDAELRIAIFPLTENGIDFRDTLATTVMTQADFVNAGVSWGTIGTLHAKFFETDIFGETTEAPIWIDGSFYLQLTNFNESGCDFGIYSDFYAQYTATTVYQQDGQFSFRAGRGGGDKYGQNLAVTFDAYFPTLAPDADTNTMHADPAGGEAFFGDDPEDIGAFFYSNVNYEDWTVETDDDWITPAIASTDYWEDYSALALVFEVEALPAGVTGRKGTITLEADGARQTIKILQGDIEDAVENTHVDFIQDGKYYNVLGVEVDENYKGVVIRNGQKFIR